MSYSMNSDEIEWYDMVCDIISKEEFIKKISRYKIEFDGLIDDSVLAHLVVDELGRNVSIFAKISDLKSRNRASLYVTVSAKPKIFEKQKGTPKAAEVS